MKKISFLILLVMVFFLAAPVSAKKDVGSVCLVAETMILADIIENTGLLDGLDRADKKLHVDISAFVADTIPEIEESLERYVSSGACDLIIGVGFIVAEVLVPFIEAYPEQKFTVIDFDYYDYENYVDVEFDNVSEILFQIDQGSFLAGYLAADLSVTGYVGVYGGGYNNRVIEFMDGYALGVAYFNDLTGQAVTVLGWDPETRAGLFLDFQFNDPELGRSLTIDLFEAGADTVFAVAGKTGEGSLEAAAEWKADGANIRVIQPDFDWYAVYGDPSRTLLTSVLKNYDVAIYNTI